MADPSTDEGTPLVTVIIPCYQQAHFLAEAIESCLRQSYRNIEIVIVNDGSTDDTTKVARSFGPRVRVIEQQNSGLSAARNAGIVHARGEVIALLDADDRLLPDCIEARVNLLLDSNERGAATGAWWHIDEQGHQTRVFGTAPRTSPELADGEYVRGNVAPTCGAIFRRRVFVNCGLYDPFLKSYEDWDMMVRVSLKWKIVYDEVPRSEYRQVPGSMSRNFLRMHDNLSMLVRKNRAYFKSGGQYWKDTVFARWCCIIGLASQIYMENSFGATVKQLASYGIKRPSAIPYLACYVLFVAPGRFLRRRNKS